MSREENLAKKWSDLRAYMNEVEAGTISQVTTMDQYYVDQKTGHLVFIYDTMKKGFPYHKDFLNDAVHMCSGFLSQPVYTMFNHRGMYPVLLKEDSNLKWTHSDRVYGEVWLVSGKHLTQMDWYHDNGEILEREKCTFETRIPLVGEQTDRSRRIRLQPWVYIGKPHAWEWEVEHSDHFMPCRRYRNNNNYQFSFYNWTDAEKDVYKV